MQKVKIVSSLLAAVLVFSGCTYSAQQGGKTWTPTPMTAEQAYQRIEDHYQTYGAGKLQSALAGTSIGKNLLNYNGSLFATSATIDKDNLPIMEVYSFKSLNDNSPEVATKAFQGLSNTKAPLDSYSTASIQASLGDKYVAFLYSKDEAKYLGAVEFDASVPTADTGTPSSFFSWGVADDTVRDSNIYVASSITQKSWRPKWSKPLSNQHLKAANTPVFNKSMNLFKVMLDGFHGYYWQWNQDGLNKFYNPKTNKTYIWYLDESAAQRQLTPLEFNGQHGYLKEENK